MRIASDVDNSATDSTDFQRRKEKAERRTAWLGKLSG